MFTTLFEFENFIVNFPFIFVTKYTEFNKGHHWLFLGKSYLKLLQRELFLKRFLGLFL